MKLKGDRMKKTIDCPSCRTGSVISIIYGMPDYQLLEQAEKGEIHLGGCIVSDNDPHYYCKECHAYIYQNNEFYIKKENE